MFATFMEVLDTTVVNVSLPHIAGSLSATPEEATWALTSYLVANAIVLPMTGWLASYFGRKRLLMTAVVGFTSASFLCGLAPNLALLVTFRILQGLTGGVLQPVSQAVMLEAFPPDQRGKAMGFWGLGIVVAPMLGPVLGGWLTDNYSWRWVFYINIPVGIASILMAKAYIFDPPYLQKPSAKVDAWGIGMLAVGIGALQFVLDKGQQEDWFSSNMIVWLMVIAVVMLLLFIIHELRTRDSDSQFESVQRENLFRRYFFDDDSRLRSVRRSCSAASVSSDGPRLSVGAGRDRRRATRSGFIFFDADRRLSHFENGSAQASYSGIGLWVGDVVGSGVDQPPGWILGYFLAAIFPGNRHGPGVRAADNRHDEHDPTGGNGQRDEPVQLHAQYGWQRRYCCRCNNAEPQCAGSVQHLGRTPQPLRSSGPWIF